MNIYQNSSNLYTFNLIDVELCRICGTSSNDLNSMFDDNGSAYDFSSKINEYLPITVRKSDYLPQKICSMCATTLLSFHQLYIVCQSTNARFLQSLEGDAYDHHVAKIPNAVDTTEYLELQSSFSREIENEILHMNESKEINEAESEIAANAAVTELERIGSAENISLVEDVVMDPVLDLHAIDDIKLDIENNESPVEANEKPSPETKPTKKNHITNGAAKKLETKKESVKKQQQQQQKKNDESKQKIKAKDKVRVAKSPKNGLNKTQKAEILKDNGVRTKQAKVNGSKEKSPAKNDTTPKKSTQKETEKTKLKCDYCSEEYDGKSQLVEHTKDVHNDLIFHCEMCDDYVARVELISHMLNHALNANSNSTAQATKTDEKIEKIDSKLPSTTNNNIEHKSTEASCKVPEKKTSSASVTAKNRSQNYCSDCDKTFADSGGFKYHINHFHKKIKQYQCDICGNHFSCKRVITNHIRGVHLKERIFECDQCAKKFSTDSALYMHKKIHENIFNSVCQVCDRKFRSMSKLKIHMTMHTKEKNYFCEICQRGFAVRNNLTKHLMTHSKSFDFKCDKCSYVANQRRYLAEHIKRSHKTQ